MRTRAIRVGAAIAALILALGVRDGAAQTTGDARRVFAGAVLAGNIEERVLVSARSGGPLAVGGTFGGTFADRWSVQVEGEWPTSDQTVVYRWDNGPPVLPSGLSRTTSRTSTVAVLLGVHWRLPKHVDVAFQFGPCLRHERGTEETQYFTNGTVTESHASSRNGWHPGASVGGAVAVNVTSRVAVVGQLRVHMQLVYEEGFALLPRVRVVRPAVGVRVRF
jgi:hypothetical protein